MQAPCRLPLVGISFVACALLLRAHPSQDEVLRLDEVVAYGREENLTGSVGSASEGRVGRAELEFRPWLRRGELLEVVPGVVVTQHSGSGKANQYFLRGFNLDHGTDLAVSVDGMPVNLRTHGHGQGYADLNFLIPEFIGSVQYEKGPYRAASGDFSNAGATRIHLTSALARPFSRLEFGEDRFLRAVAGGTVFRPDGGNTTVGLEAAYQDGPWEVSEHSVRLNAFARQEWASGTTEHALTLLGYHGAWTSTDQVPARALEQGRLGRFDSLDASDGGDSDRLSLSYARTTDTGAERTSFDCHAVWYRMALFSNFTYFLDDPVNGDQFAQRDERGQFVANLARSWETSLGPEPCRLSVGGQVQGERLRVGLERTRERDTIEAVRLDEVNQAVASAHVQAEFWPARWVTVIPGARVDAIGAQVDSDLRANSGVDGAMLVSPKLAVVLGPWSRTEFFLNAGAGFHSNDARGATARVEPANPAQPVEKLDLLARSRGAEIGLRTLALDGFVSTLALWLLELDSEFVFAGDSGVTEALAATRRVGLEWTNFYKVSEVFAVDADLALTHARFVEAAGEAPYEGRRIPGSIAIVATGGCVARLGGGWTTSLRARYFGPQPLEESGAVHSDDSLTFSARLAWRGKDWEVALSVLNLLNSANTDISYFYESRLPWESAGVFDTHVHPAEPRTLRLAVSRWF